MLNILVCVKQVPDVDLVKMDPETGNLVREGVPTYTNPLDLNALEAAVRVKKEYGGEVTAITMGPPMAESTLRECISVGADNAVLVTGRPFGGADTLSTSYSILMAANMLGKKFDMIFCGKESVDGATGQMGSQLAERFDTAQVTGCLKILNVDCENMKVLAERELEKGVETVEADLPCLFTVEKENYRASIPNLRGKMAAKKAAITVFTENDIDGLEMDKIGVSGSGTIVPRIYPPELPEPGQILCEGSAEKDVSRLFELLTARGAI